MYTTLSFSSPDTFFSSNISTLSEDELQRLINIGGLTFYKNYNLNRFINADYSIGSPVATYTCSRGASNPATYIDNYGIIQVTTTSNQPRFTNGFYNSSGFNSRYGILMERAATNFIIRTDGSSIGNITGGTGWTGWSPEFNTATTPVYSNPLVPELSSISGARSQRLQWSGTATNNNVKLISTNTSVGSFVQNDVATVSGWIRSQTGNFGDGLKANLEVWFRDSAGTALTINFGNNFLNSGVDTQWRRFQQSFTATDVNTSRLNVKIGCQAGIDTGDILDIEYYGIQVEKKPYASTWIPTTTAALTRNIETLTYPISGNKTAAMETCAFRYTPFWDGSQPVSSTAIHDTDTVRRLFFLRLNDDDMAFFPNNTNSPGTAVLVVPDTVAFENQIAVCAMQSTGDPNAQMYVNGSLTSTNNNDYTENAWGTNFYIGTTSGQSVFDGIITSVAFYNRFLNSSEASLLTNILSV